MISKHITGRAMRHAAMAAISLLPFAFAAVPVAAAYQPQEIAVSEVFTHPDAVKLYKDNPGRFIFKTLADLPKDLKWEDGAGEEPFAAPEAKRGGTLTIGIPAYPPTLRRNGPSSNNSVRSYIYDNQSCGLIGFHPNTGNHVPELATHWAMSADHRTCYFRLDPRARFNDGQPITADDYFFTFFTAQCDYISDVWGKDYYGNEFASITKYDDFTIAITLPTPKPDPFIFASISPVPRNFYRELGPDFMTRYQRRYEPMPGAYALLPGDDRTEQSITMSRLDHWWGDDQKFLSHRYNPDRMVFKVVREADKAVQIFLSGQQDLTLLPAPKYWYQLNQKDPVKNGWVEKAVFYNDYPRPPYGFYLNASHPPLDNREVRLGLQYATDWQRVINTFFRGDYDRLNQFAQGYGKYTDGSIKARPYDPDEAMRHFAKAGYTQRGPDGILRNKAGARLSFSLLVDDGDRKKMLPAFIDSARKAGVEFTPRAIERTTMYKEVMEKNHDIVFWAWSSIGIWPEFRQSFHDENAFDENGKKKTNTNNITMLRDPELSAMIDEFRNLTDEKSMVELSKKMQRRIDDDAVFIPGYCVPGYRMAYWRWMKFPKTFDVRRGDDPFTFSLFWIDEDVKRETEEAMAAGKTFPVKSRVYDEFRTE